MANPTLQPIYNRLNGLNNYHPITANTFADWSIEAGDIITVKRGDESYSSPTHSVSLRWSGQPKVVLDSKGEKTRGSVAKMSAQSYNSGGGGGAAYRSGYGGRRQTEEKLADVQVGLNSVYAYARNVESTMYSELEITNERIRLETVNRTNKDRELSGKIEVEAGRISLLVSENGKVRAGVIVDAINESGSNVTISGDHVKIEGNVSLNNVMSVSGNYIRMKKPVVVDNNYIMASELRLRSGDGSATLTGGNMENVIIGASVSGNVLTLTPLRGNPVNFSKATTLSGQWSGRVFTVTAKQNNVTVGTKAGIVYDGIVPDYATNSWTKSGNHYYATQDFLVYADDDGDAGSTIMRKNLSINADAIWSDGYQQGGGGGGGDTYRLFGYFDKYGTVSVEGQTYTAYITQDTSDSASHLALYKKI